MGAEEVMLVTEDDPHNVIDLWGDKANELKKIMKEDKNFPETVTLRDYTSYDFRAVWVDLGGKRIEIERGKWPWPFLGWVARIGGTSLEEKQFQRKPLLANMYHFDLYDDINRVRTLRFSDMIRTASEPRDVFESDTRTSPDVDASSGDLYTRIRTEESLTPRPGRVPDPSMSTLYAELRSDIQKSTLSEMLLGADVPTGAAFASINLVTESALKVLRSPQALAQYSLGDILETMLLFIHYDDSEVTSYGTGKNDRGDVYLIDGSEIDPKNLYISVKLEADLPTDYQARTVTARAQIDAGINSRVNAMEDIGIKNVSETEEEIASERLSETMLRVEMENIQYTESVQLREQMMQEAMKRAMSDPKFIQQIAGQIQAQQQPQRRPGEPERGVQDFSGEVETESLVPSEANAAEGGPTTEEFASQEIRARQQEGL
jgi:hypothetical protein